MNDNTDKEAASKFRNYLATHLPKANTRKIYFDYGDKDFDSSYQFYQEKLDAVMKQKGWLGKYWQTKYFRSLAKLRIIYTWWRFFCSIP